MRRDLNLKKSWHPATVRRQANVHAAQSAALRERRKIEELTKQREKEGSMQELKDLQQQSGSGTKPTVDYHHQLEWMYQKPASSTNTSLPDESREAYLLGKRRINGGDVAEYTDACGEMDRYSGDVAKKGMQDPLRILTKGRRQQVLEMRERQSRRERDVKGRRCTHHRRNYSDRRKRW